MDARGRRDPQLTYIHQFNVSSCSCYDVCSHCLTVCEIPFPEPFSHDTYDGTSDAWYFIIPSLNIGSLKAVADSFCHLAPKAGGPPLCLDTPRE